MHSLYGSLSTTKAFIYQISKKQKWHSYYASFVVLARLILGKALLCILLCSTRAARSHPPAQLAWANAERDAERIRNWFKTFEPLKRKYRNTKIQNRKAFRLTLSLKPLYCHKFVGYYKRLTWFNPKNANNHHRPLLFLLCVARGPWFRSFACATDYFSHPNFSFMGPFDHLSIYSLITYSFAGPLTYLMLLADRNTPLH